MLPDDVRFGRLLYLPMNWCLNSYSRTKLSVHDARCPARHYDRRCAVRTCFSMVHVFDAWLPVTRVSLLPHFSRTIMSRLGQLKAHGDMCFVFTAYQIVGITPRTARLLRCSSWLDARLSFCRWLSRIHTPRDSTRQHYKKQGNSLPLSSLTVGLHPTPHISPPTTTLLLRLVVQ